MTVAQTCLHTHTHKYPFQSQFLLRAKSARIFAFFGHWGIFFSVLATLCIQLCRVLFFLCFFSRGSTLKQWIVGLTLVKRFVRGSSKYFYYLIIFIFLLKKVLKNIKIKIDSKKGQFTKLLFPENCKNIKPQKYFFLY